MALLERVGTLLRANVNDMIDKAEDPEKLLKQVVLDMENQLLQLKTQVAITLADQHLLEKKKKEHEDAVATWTRKAELAVGKGQDDLARAALDRSLSHTRMAEGFAQQLDDGRGEAETLHAAFLQLGTKLRETESQCALLIAQHRRARTAGNANKARAAASGEQPARTLERMRAKILKDQAVNEADRLLSEGSLEAQFSRMERDDRIEDLLQELREKQLNTGVANRGLLA